MASRYVTPEDMLLHNQFMALEARVKALESGAGLGNSSITKGGFAVRSGADLNVSGGGNVRVSGGGSVIIDDGGNIDMLAGGILIARYPTGAAAVHMGTIPAIGETLNGLFVFTSDEEQGSAFFVGRRGDGTSQAAIGDVSAPIEFLTTFNDTMFMQSGFGSVKGDIVVVGVTDDVRRMQIQGDGLFLITPDTTGSAANVRIGATGFLAIVSSSAVHKVDVEDLNVDTEALLRLRPRTWRDRGEVERDPETDRWHVGLVAEEVDAAGLHEFVDYDEDGDPQAVAYDRLVVALLEVVKQQQQRLDALDGGVQHTAPERPRKPKRRESSSVLPKPEKFPKNPREAAKFPRGMPEAGRESGTST